jgi:hypothetical protein
MAELDRDQVELLHDADLVQFQRDFFTAEELNGVTLVACHINC